MEILENTNINEFISEREKILHELKLANKLPLKEIVILQ
jgi:hypothetical protein